jgi:hypothetical protein
MRTLQHHRNASPSSRKRREITPDQAAIKPANALSAIDPADKKLPDSPTEPKRARADLIGRFAKSAGCKQRLLVSSWTRNLIARV